MSTETKYTSQRFRISPRGLINLAEKERRTLAVAEGESRFVDVTVEGHNVRISPAQQRGPNSVKVSPRGLLQLPSEAHHALSGGKKGFYSLSAQDEKGIHLRPA
jgi:hypothetical protein